MITILLVEDSQIAQKIASSALRSALTPHSFHLDIVDNGKDAMAAIENHYYDLVFMDIGLPDIDGLTVTEMLRNSDSLGRVVPIVALTAHIDPHIREDSISVGMTDYVTKPLTKEVAKQILNQYVLIDKKCDTSVIG